MASSSSSSASASCRPGRRKGRRRPNSGPAGRPTTSIPRKSSTTWNGTSCCSALNRDEQKAYWINLYNALTVKVVLDHYPVRTIRLINLSSRAFARGPWDTKLLTVEGEELSLNDIEHRILRPIWQDPRVHYAVNCASLGCPNLQPQAFTGRDVEMQLEKAAREFINHPRGVSFPRNRLQVSSIYFWFQEDFGGSEKGIIKHLRKYLTGKNLEQLDKVEKRIGHDYDWNLND